MASGRTTIWILACVLVAMTVRAAISDSPGSRYEAIMERNVFNLHAPPPREDADALKPKAQIPKLTLNGITTILGRKMAVLTAPSTKPGAPATTVMLAEGQAQDEVEVRQIDEKTGVVNVVNHGEEEALDFEHNGAKPSPPPVNAATPLRIPPAPANGIPSPGMNVIRPLRTLPSRSTTPFGGPGNQVAQ